MTGPLRILVVNDDGIDADGLWLLAEAMSSAGEVTVVAPRTDQTGAGTGITVIRKLEVEEVAPRVIGVRAYSVDGTPGDCVAIGLREVVAERVDMIASGVNYGANLGRALLFSGTVGAAMQGHFRALPAIAVSAEYHPGTPPNWATAGAVCRMLALEAARGALPSDALLNVNVPDRPLHEVAGVRITRLASGPFLRLRANRAPRQDANDAFERMPEAEQAEEGTDIWAIVNGYVSITPIHADTTSYPHLDRIGQELTLMLGQVAE